MAKPTWSQVEPYIQQAYEQYGRVERADAMEIAEADNVDDDMVDTIDAIGSRVFKTPDDVRAFLQSQNLLAS